jgi:hypothetical protein
MASVNSLPVYEVSLSRAWLRVNVVSGGSQKATEQALTLRVAARRLSDGQA